MEREKFDELIDQLAAMKGKDLKKEQREAWFKAFGWMYPTQLEGIFKEAGEVLNRFPSDRWVNQQIRARSIKRPGGDNRRYDIIVVECPHKGVPTDEKGNELHRWRCQRPKCGTTIYAFIRPTKCPRCHWHGFDDLGAEVRDCQGAFALRVWELTVAAEAGLAYPCPNRKHYGCPMMFEATKLAGMVKDGVVRREAFASSQVR